MFGFRGIYGGFDSRWVFWTIGMVAGVVRSGTCGYQQNTVAFIKNAMELALNYVGRLDLSEKRGEDSNGLEEIVMKP